MERMLMTQALDERDLLRKKICDAISKFHCLALKKPGSEVISGSSKQPIEDFNKEAKADLQRINDLIDRYKRLDAAILLANANTKITVAGEEMTRAAAINLRRAIACDDCKKNNFEFKLMEAMKLQLDLAHARIAETEEAANKQREAMATSLTANDKKTLSDDNLKSINQYCDNLVLTLVDPIGVADEIADLQRRQDELRAGLDSAIKISNATEYVEF